MKRAWEAVAAEKWAITEAYLKTIVAVAERQGDPEALAAKLSQDLEGTYRAEIRDGVAIIGVKGPLFRYANVFTAISGASSYQVLARDFTAALENVSVKAILLFVDSPGGMVNGCHELAAMIHAARGKKPIVAYVGGMGASAAYWIASAADEVVVDATAELGSIGAVLQIVDSRERDAKEGVRIHQIVSSQSPNKRPDPAQDQGQAQFQAEVDALAQVFVEAVAVHRGVDAGMVLEQFGGGAIFVGAAAVEAGLADRLGSFEEVLAGLAQGRVSGPTYHNGGRTMKSYADALAAGEIQPITAGELKEKHPDLAQAIAGEAMAKAKAEGAQGERERIRGVYAAALPGHDDLVEAMAWDGKTTPGEAALAINAAERQAQRAAIKGRKQDAEILDGIRDSGEAGKQQGEDYKPGTLAEEARKAYAQAGQ